MKEKYIKIKKKTVITSFIILIIIAVLYSLYKKNDNKFKRYYSIIPPIEIRNYMSADREFGMLGDAVGLVAFDDGTNAPKGIKQFYIFDTVRELEDDYKLSIIIKDLVIVGNEPLTEIGEEKAYFEEQIGDTVVFIDKNENRYFFKINFNNEDIISITMKDTTGDETYLITDRDEYRDYLWEDVRGNKAIN